MVKATADLDRDHVDIEAEGSPTNIMAEVTSIVREVYLSIKEQDPDAAETFRDRFTHLVNRLNSPVWRDEEEGEDA